MLVQKSEATPHACCIYSSCFVSSCTKHQFLMSVVKQVQFLSRHAKLPSWCSKLSLSLPWGSCDAVVACFRGAMLAMLQRIASSQQGLSSQPHPSPFPSLSPSRGTVPSSAAVALQQRHLQQLLYQHQPQQPHSACQVPFSQQKLAASAKAAAFGSWPWQAPSPAAASASLTATPVPTVTEPLISPPVFAPPPDSLSALTADQQACPRLDGSFLAECIKPSVPLPCVNSCNQPSQMPLQLPLPTPQVLSASHVPVTAALSVKMQADRPASASIVSPTLSFSSAPSTMSSVSAVPTLSPSPEAQLPVDLCSADPSFESFGMHPGDSRASLDLKHLHCALRVCSYWLCFQSCTNSNQLTLYACAAASGLRLQTLILLMSLYLTHRHMCPL